MSRWVFAILVAAAFVMEAAWSASMGSGGPSTRLVEGARAIEDEPHPVRDPLHAWNADNATLDAILASAVWPGARVCLRPGECHGGSRGAHRAL